MAFRIQIAPANRRFGCFMYRSRSYGQGWSGLATRQADRLGMVSVKLIYFVCVLSTLYFSIDWTMIRHDATCKFSV